MLAWTIGDGIIDAAGTIFALQQFIDGMATLFSIQLLNPKAKYFNFLSILLFIRIVYCTRLMPCLDVLAVSQAPSLEQNPNALVLVYVSEVHYRTD